MVFSEEWTEEDVQKQIENRLDEINGYVNTIGTGADGKYHSTMFYGIGYGEGNTDLVGNEIRIYILMHEEALFEEAHVDLAYGILYVTGKFGVYDSDWNETVFGFGKYKLRLANGCKFISSGGTGDDVEISPDLITEYFKNHPESHYGLDIVLTIEDGLVTKVDVGS